MGNVLSDDKTAAGPRARPTRAGRCGGSRRRRASAARRPARYLRAAGIAVRGRGGGRRSRPPKPAIAAEVSTDSERAKPAIRGGVHRLCAARPPPRPSAERERVRAVPRADRARRSARGRNAMAIWQDLVDDHGFAARYASVRRFVRDAARRDAAGGARRHHDRARRRGQVDYGEGPMVRDRDDGQVPPHAALRPDARLQPQVGAAARRGDRARRSGPSCTSARFAGSAARRASSSSTTCARACSRPTSTTRRSIRSIATCSRTTASSRCRAASRDPDRKGKVEAGVGHAQKTPLQGPALRDARGGAGVPRSLGGALGRHAHPRHDEAAGRRDVCRGAAGAAAAARSSRFATTATASAPCISMAASKSRPRTTARRPAGSASASRCSGTTCTSACSTRRPGSCCASICAAPRGWHRIARRRPAGAHAADDASRCSRARRRAGAHIGAVCDAHPPARRRARRPPDPRRARARQEARRRPSSTTPRKAALELGVPTYRFLRRYLERRPPAPLTLAPGRSAHPPAHPLPRPHRSQDRRPAMNLVELDRALRKLRLSGMADVLETRLRHAQTEKLAPIDLVSTLVVRRAAAPAGPPARAPHQAGAASATPTARSTPSISISTRR